MLLFVIILFIEEHLEW